MTHTVNQQRHNELDPDANLAFELAAVSRRRWWNRWTLYLGVAVLILGAFIAGIQAQKSYGPAPTAAGTGQGGAGRPGGFTPASPGRSDTGTGRNSATTVIVKPVDGTTVYVETTSGEVVTVRTNSETAVRVSGTLKNVKAGDKVSVEGAADAEGAVTATTLTSTK